MTKRDLCQKWLVYALGLFPLWLLDCYVLCRYPVLGVTPILLPLTVAAVATMEGQMSGGIFGMCVGFLWETTYPQGVGAMIFILTLFGYLAGSSMQYVLKKGFFGYFVSSLLTLLAVEALIVLFWLFSGKVNYLQILPQAGKQVLLTMAYSPLVYWVFRKIYHKVSRYRAI